MNAPRSSDGVGTRRIVTSASAAAASVGRRAQALARCRDERPAAPAPRPARARRSSSRDGLGVDVDAEHVVALAREHGGERRAELAESDDGDPHRAQPASAVIEQVPAEPALERCGTAASGIQRKYGSFT